MKKPPEPIKVPLREVNLVNTKFFDILNIIAIVLTIIVAPLIAYVKVFK